MVGSEGGRTYIDTLERLMPLLLTGAIVLTAIAAVGNLPVGGDEMLNMTVPRNLVLKGIYGTATYSETVLFNPQVTTGPVVLLPVAAVQRVAGIGLVQNRLVPILYFGLLLILTLRILRMTPSTSIAGVVTMSSSLRHRDTLDKR